MPRKRLYKSEEERLEAIRKAQKKYFQSEKGKKAVEYLKNRGISGEVAKFFSLGYSTNSKPNLYEKLSSKFDIHATEGNFNTSIGLPLTLLQLTSFHGASILEMGANQIGDIDILAKIAKPNIGVITNIAPAHLEGFGTIEAVAKTKAALFENLINGLEKTK